MTGTLLRVEFSDLKHSSQLIKYFEDQKETMTAIWMTTPLSNVYFIMYTCFANSHWNWSLIGAAYTQLQFSFYIDSLATNLSRDRHVLSDPWVKCSQNI